jgi:DNA-binding CsgD family transcriptional regulator
MVRLMAETQATHSAFILTEQERLVCRLLLQGMEQKEIAQCLQVRANTVHKYTMTIREKLGVDGTNALLLRLAAMSDELQGVAPDGGLLPAQNA